VGYCQANFNSRQLRRRTASTLDYGPFGFCELFGPDFSPGPAAASIFSFFSTNRWQPKPTIDVWASIRLLLDGNTEALARLGSDPRWLR